MSSQTLTVEEQEWEAEYNKLMEISNSTMCAEEEHKNKKTTQLEREEQQRLEFESNCQDMGLEYLDDWGSGALNKKTNKNTDDNVKICCILKLSTKLGVSVDELYKLDWSNGTVIGVNRKTLGGAFTWLNGGVYTQCTLAKELNLSTNDNLQKLQEDINSIQNKIGKEKRWKEIGQEQKEPIFEKLYDCWSALLVGREKDIYDLYNARLSHLDYIGNKLSLSKLKKIKYDENICIKKNKDYRIQVGALCIRFKAAGVE